MDIEEFKNIEKLQNELNKTHKNYVDNMKPILNLYASTYYLKKGQQIDDSLKAKEKAEQEINDLIEYMNSLNHTAQQNFELARRFYYEAKKS